jgi:6-pyruvoyl-tetrahydropterin synthase
MINQLEKLLFNHNWGNSSFNIKQFNNPSLISAGIEDQGSWKVHISFDENLSKLDNILSECDKKFNQNYFLDKNNLDNLLYFIVGHEIGHWKYCPAHIDDREEILSGVAEGLEESGFTKEKIEQHSHRLYNYFADIIDNTMNMYRDDNKEKYCDGFLAFYANQGLINEYSDDFAIFVDINAKLGINKQDTKNFASHFCKNYSQFVQLAFCKVRPY